MIMWDYFGPSFHILGLYLLKADFILTAAAVVVVMCFL
jgi:hypothetical protein